MRKEIGILGVALPLLIGASLMRPAVPTHQDASSLGGVTWTTTVLEDGHVRLDITNGFSSPITALVAVGDRTLLADSSTMRSVRFFDSVLSPFGPKEVAPGRSYSFIFFGPNPPANKISRDVQLKAVVFADGRGVGDADWLTTLAARRVSARKYSALALQAIQSTTLEDEASRRSLLDVISAMRGQDVRAAGSVAERQIADLSLSDAVNLLSDGTGTGAPSKEAIIHARGRILMKLARLDVAKPIPTP